MDEVLFMLEHLKHDRTGPYSQLKPEIVVKSQQSTEFLSYRANFALSITTS
jgi:hypothetical protein